MDRTSYRGKRAFDLIGAGAACVLFAPPSAVVALATWLDDRGPPLFLQARVGCRRRPFEIFKFRSMRDHRVTRVGRWLRSTGIDEFPQFLNVCRGEMSLVGPRPLTADDLGRLGWNQSSMDWRFEARPGITGLSQLFGGRGARASLRLDRLYLETQSVWLDVQLLALSLAVNVIGKRTVRRWARCHRRGFDRRTHACFRTGTFSQTRPRSVRRGP
jgi:undecaprenyl phosphate N,N'-diacetylbacillosamine 1-phosphate transferase